MINVQFSDSSKTKIISVFHSPQDEVIYPHQGTLQDTDPLYIAFMTPTVAPDGAGFIQTVKTALGGIVAANALAVAYPLFYQTVQDQHWADVQTLIIDAKATGKITAAQYTAFKAAASSHNIPVTL